MFNVLPNPIYILVLIQVLKSCKPICNFNLMDTVLYSIKYIRVIYTINLTNISLLYEFPTGSLSSPDVDLIL